MNKVNESLKYLGVAFVGLCLVLACAGTPPHAAMPTALVGLEVIVGPGVAMAGAGVRKFPAFGNALTSAIESRLAADGFQVVTATRGQNAVRIAIRANLEVTQNQFIIINGRPMESNSATVAVQVIGPDGALADGFDVSGDPEDAGMPRNVAANVAEHMKGSARLVALATAGPRTAAPPSSVPVNASLSQSVAAAARGPAEAPPTPAPSPARTVSDTALGQDPSLNNKRKELWDAMAAARDTDKGDASRECATARYFALFPSDGQRAEMWRLKCDAEQRKATEAAARGNTERFVAGDLAKARAAGVNLSVFGVPLGEPSTIPDCPKIDMFTMTTAQVNEARAAKATMDACRVDAGDGPMNWASAMVLDPEGAGYSQITLAASKRPPWVTTAGMLIKGGGVIAVTIATTDENQHDQVAALRAKYGKPQPQSVEGVLEWRLPGLYVQFQDRSSIPQPTQYVGGNLIGNAAMNYGSIMGHATKPNLFIMLESVHKNQLERKAAKKAAEPKL